MSLMPIQGGKPVIDSRQVGDLLTSSSGGKDEGLASASKAVASIGKFASFIPGIGTAIGAVCGAISGFLSFLASPSG